MKIDYHPHLLARMEQRGVTAEEIERTLTAGRTAPDAKPGTQGKVLVFEYQDEWLGQVFEEKEVTVYYKMIGGDLVVLTARARYGRHFPRG